MKVNAALVDDSARYGNNIECFGSVSGAKMTVQFSPNQAYLS